MRRPASPVPLPLPLRKAPLEDYAVALVDELERGRNRQRRMAVAY